MDDALYEGPRQVHLVGSDDARLHDLLGLHHRDTPRRGTLRIAVGRGGGEDEVLMAVGGLSVHQVDVRSVGLFQEPASYSTVMRAIGMQRRPKPATAAEAPSGRS